MSLEENEPTPEGEKGTPPRLRGVSENLLQRPISSVWPRCQTCWVHVKATRHIFSLVQVPRVKRFMAIIVDQSVSQGAAGVLAVHLRDGDVARDLCLEREAIVEDDRPGLRLL